VPRWLKVVVWVTVFAAFAGAGAFAASQTDPFPPGVEDPGARDGSLAPATASPSPATIERWWIGVRGSAVHTFRVGGTCRSSWRGSARVRLDADGITADAAPLELAGEGSCDFPVAQPQTEVLTIELEGTRQDGDLDVATRVVERSPAGSDDLGGFAVAIGRERFVLGSGGAAGAGSQVPDGRGGTIEASIRLVSRCVSGCV